MSTLATVQAHLLLTSSSLIVWGVDELFRAIGRARSP
jgi:hypothetical protein